MTLQCPHGILVSCLHCDMAAALDNFVKKAATLERLAAISRRPREKAHTLLGCSLEDAVASLRITAPNDVKTALFIRAEFYMAFPELPTNRRYKFWNVRIRSIAAAAGGAGEAEARAETGLAGAAAPAVALLLGRGEADVGHAAELRVGDKLD